MHGAADMRDGSWCMTLLTRDGRYDYNGGECGLDIVSEWVDEPKIDPEIWKGLAVLGLYYVVKSCDMFFAFAEKPKWQQGVWVSLSLAMRIDPAVYLEPCEPKHSLAVSPLLPKQ